MQEHYALNLALNVLLDEGKTGAEIKNNVDTFFSNNEGKLASLGTRLQETVNTAFSDGILSVDKQKAITTIQSQMAAITEAVAASRFEANLEVMGMNFSGSQLTGESFKLLQEQINTEVLAAKGEYTEALQLAIANANAMRNSGDISQAEHDTMVSELKGNYLTQVSEIEAKAASFQNNTIMDAYKNELPAFAEQFISDANEMVSMVESGTSPLVTQLDGFMQDMLRFDGADKAARQNIADLYENMLPTLEGLNAQKEALLAAGREIPAELSEEIFGINMTGAMSGNADAMYAALGTVLGSQNPEFAATLEQLYTNGGAFSDRLIEGIRDKDYAVENAAIGTADIFLRKTEAELNKGIVANIPINASLNGSASAINRTESIPMFANGSYDTPSAFIAGERGPELITNAAGSRVFTTNETRDIFNPFSQYENLDNPSTVLH